MTYQPPADPYATQPRRGGSGLAVAALVVGVLALVTCWTVIGGVVFGLVAIVLGLLALSKARKGLAGGRGMAIGGIVTGALGLVLAGALFAFGLSLLTSDPAKQLRECVERAGNDPAARTQCQREFERELQN